MSLIGNPLVSTNYQTDTFSGNGSTVAYTLSVAPASAASIAVYISGLYQTPVSAYTVSGTTLTFTGAPPTGTGNILVLHLGIQSSTLVPVAQSITPAMLNNANVIFWSTSNTNVGIGNTAPGAPLTIGSASGTFTNPLFQAAGNANSWIQLNAQNLNNGNNASTDLVLARSDGNDTSGFIDMGINSNTYAQAAYSIMTPRSGYLFTNGGDLVLGTQTAHNVLFHTGNTTSASERMRIDTSGRLLINNTFSTGGLGSITSYAADGSYAAVLRGGTYGLRMFSDAASGYSLQAVDSTGSVSYQPLLLGGGGIRFFTGTAGGGSQTEAMRIDSSAQVGINTASPIRALTIAGEQSFTIGSSGTAFINVSEAGGNNGSLNSFMIRGLASSGAAEAVLANITLRASNVYIGSDGACNLSDLRTKSLATNGYQKLPGGLMFQWGQASIAANSTATINFNITFGSSCASLVATHGAGGIWQAYNQYTTGPGGVQPISTSQFQLSNLDDSTVTYYWFAVGY